MAANYLLQEDGSKILLEDGSGAIILDAGAPVTDDGYRKIISLREDGTTRDLG